MKATEIQVGRYYHDGKQGVREVVSVDRDLVVYRIHAAKVQNEYTYAPSNQEVQVKSLIGSTSMITLPGFAGWAKAGYDQVGIQPVLAKLQAARIKLAPGEDAFMCSVLRECGRPVGPGTRVSYDHMEGRAVGGLQRKGLLTKCEGDEVEMTVLGQFKLQELDSVGAGAQPASKRMRP